MATLTSFRISLLWGFILSLTLLPFAQPTIAQVLSDGSLPTPTVVNTVGNTSNISGGTRPNDGQNLFHSFSQFDVAAGQTAMFLSATPALGNSTTNIIGRITNQNPSSIFGMVDTASNFSMASLWLMGPGGFIFGPQSQLNVAGTFAAVTANSLEFEDGTMFPAVPDATVDGLLNVSNVVAMEFMGSDTPVIAAGSNAAIEIQGLHSQGADVLIVARDAQAGEVGSTVPSVLVNGNVKTEGGDFIVGSANAPGRAVLGSIHMDAIPQLGDVQFDPGGKADVTHPTDPSVGGRIVIRSGNFRIQGPNAELKASVANGTDPSIDIDVRDEISIQEGGLSTIITNETNEAGSIHLSGDKIGLNGGTIMSQVTDPTPGGFFVGKSGSINLAAGTSIDIGNSSKITNIAEFATEGTGDVTFTTPDLTIGEQGGANEIIVENQGLPLGTGDVVFNVRSFTIVNDSNYISINRGAGVSAGGGYHIAIQGVDGDASYADSVSLSASNGVNAENFLFSNNGDLEVYAKKIDLNNAIFFGNPTVLLDGDSLSSVKSHISVKGSKGSRMDLNFLKSVELVDTVIQGTLEEGGGGG